MLPWRGRWSASRTLDPSPPPPSLKSLLTACRLPPAAAHNSMSSDTDEDALPLPLPLPLLPPPPGRQADTVRDPPPPPTSASSHLRLRCLLPHPSPPPRDNRRIRRGSLTAGRDRRSWPRATGGPYRGHRATAPGTTINDGSGCPMAIGMSSHCPLAATDVWPSSPDDDVSVIGTKDSPFAGVHPRGGDGYGGRRRRRG